TGRSGGLQREAADARAGARGVVAAVRRGPALSHVEALDAPRRGVADAARARLARGLRGVVAAAGAGVAGSRVTVVRGHAIGVHRALHALALPHAVRRRLGA